MASGMRRSQVGGRRAAATLQAKLENIGEGWQKHLDLELDARARPFRRNELELLVLKSKNLLCRLLVHAEVAVTNVRTCVIRSSVAQDLTKGREAGG